LLEVRDIKVVHRKSSRLVALAVAGLVLVALALPATASAHERRSIGNGQYDVVVGWSVEPAYVGMKNTATIRIMNAGTTTPVTGAEKGLKLTIRQGASTQAFPLAPVFGQDGLYQADIVPTRVGDYQWIFTGTIGEASINETFDTADGKFNAVQPANAVQFPVQIGDPVENMQAVQSAQADAQSARALAMAGIAVGILGLVAALVSLGRSMRHGQTAPAVGGSTTRPASERV
jgi:hypothetical protein